MQTRNTLVMAVVLVAISAFVYFYEIRGRDARAEVERLETLLTAVDATEVTGVTLTNAHGTVEAVKTDATWRIVAPVAVAANSSAFEELLEAVTGASKQRVVVEGAKDLEPFGLVEPFATVVLKSGDTELARIQSGNETPVGGSAYATVGDSGDVVSTLAALRTVLDKSLFDLRDRGIMSFDSTAIGRVEFERDGLNAVLQRSDTGWAAEAPFSGSADSESVNGLLRVLNGAEARAFVTDAAPDAVTLANHGLDTPQITATLRGADDASYKLLIGAAASEPDGFYAMREGGDSIFVVGADLLDDIPSDASTLRDRQVLAVNRQRIAEITIDRSGEPSLQLARQGVNWLITEPQSIVPDVAAISRLLGALTDLRAEDFGRSSGASTATVRVGLRDPGADDEPIAEIVEIAIGARSSITPDPEGDAIDVIAVTPSGSSTAFLVPADALDGILVDLFDLRSKTLVEFTPESLETVMLSTATGGSFTLTKSGETWASDVGDLGETDVSDVLWDLNYLNMEAVMREWTGAAPDLSEFGLDSPRLHVVASDADGVVADVRIGSETADAAAVYAMIGEQNAVYQISPALADVLAALVERLGS